MSVLLSAPTDYFSNSSRSYNPEAPPDRFTPIPGNGNFRGARIDNFRQMKLLKQSYGVKTIVNLAQDSMRLQKSGDGFECECTNCLYLGPQANACEPQWARALGLNYIYVPLGGSCPSEEDYAVIQEALIDGHAYVHCTHGVDRTGGVVGRWVREVLGLSDSEIIDYTYSFGGQWTDPSDPNHRLRDCMLNAPHNPSLVGAIRSASRAWLPFVLIGGATLIAGAVVYRFRYK